MGNIVNRVFDSSGPEGKVRGTPAQIIEKYQFLARDAQLSNDRVAAEAFQQHAEHYTRMLSEATREMQREADARQAQNGQQGGQQSWRDQNGGQRDQNGRDQNGRDHGYRQHDDGRDAGPDRSDERQPERQPDRQPERPQEPVFQSSQPDAPRRRERQPRVQTAEVIDTGGDAEGDSGLVETPETADAPAPKSPRRRSPRKPKGFAGDGAPATLFPENNGGDGE